MKKVTIIGAGNVGGTLALRVAESGLADVAIIDINDKLALAKACDLKDSNYSNGKYCKIEASGDLSLMKDSDVVVVTAGLARKPGMTREELLAKNSEIIKGVCEGIVKFAKNAIVIVVSNPLDIMTYLVLKTTNFSKKKVFGMGAGLDTSRFANLISEKLSVSTQDIRALVIGSHGETMLPLPRHSTVKGKPLTELMKEDEAQALAKLTKSRGAQIVSLYGTGSAYMGPAAAIFQIVKTILSGSESEIPVSAYLEGEYGEKGLCIGVPAKISSQGLKEVIEIKLSEQEKAEFAASAKSIKESIKALKL